MRNPQTMAWLATTALLMETSDNTGQPPPMPVRNDPALLQRAQERARKALGYRVERMAKKLRNMLKRKQPLSPEALEWLRTYDEHYGEDR